MLGAAANAGAATEVAVYLLLFLHIATMLSGVAAAGGLLFITLIAARGRRWSTVAAISDLNAGRLIAPVFTIGGVFGLLTAIAFGYPLLSAWLVIAYVLFALLAIHGARFIAVETSRLLPQLITPEGAADPELVRRFNRAFASDFLITTGLLLLIVADMVFKPFL